jgi:hypothetical protein
MKGKCAKDGGNIVHKNGLKNLAVFCGAATFVLTK